jgi:KaiC/GvpD/RAD55 family RecA-like ATPase
MELATTGISGLDAQLGGGFPRGATVLVLGDPCNALSVFAEQFCAGGLTQGEHVLFFQFDRSPKAAPARIVGLAQSLGQVSGRLRVFDGYSGQFGANGKAAVPGVQPMPQDHALGEVLNQGLQVQGGKYRLAVDSLSSIARPGKEQEVLDFVRHLVHVGQETGALQLLTLVRGVADPQFEARLKHACTGVMEIGVERKGFGLYNYLQITKLMDLRDPTRLLLFKETDKGLWLESTKRVF